MIFDENGKNDLYERIDVSTERKKSIIDACMEAHGQNLEKSNDELSEKRLQKNKKIHDDLLSKAAIAAVSIGLSGALLSGVFLYNNNNSKKSANGVADETDTNEVTSEYVQETENNDGAFSDGKILLGKDDTTNFKRIFPMKNNLEVVVDDKYAETSKKKVGDYTLKVFNEHPEREDYVCCVKLYGNGEKEGYIIPDLLPSDFENCTFFNGESLLYCSCGKLYYFNMKTKESNSLCPNIDCDDTLAISTVKNGKVILSVYTSEFGEEDVISLALSYDLKSGKIQTERGRTAVCGLEEDDNYFITMDYFIDKDGNEKRKGCFVEKITEDGFKEVVNIGEHTECNRVLSTDSDKLYFNTYKVNKDGTESTLNITIKSFDKKTEEVKDVVKLTAAMFGYTDTDFSVQKITDKYCIVEFFETDGSLSQYKYQFDTKKISKVEK